MYEHVFNEKIMVSVYCTTYNHEKYVRDALEGFINQKTNFRYEVIVHDDASTDDTASIIREYEEKYPQIIKGIYQRENRYSKGEDIFDKYILPCLQGKYIAICEGDDYWIDNNKLQKQFDALEYHPDCDMCAHKAKWFDCTKKKVTKVFPKIDEEKVICAEDIIYGEGGFLPTASLFFRRNIRINHMNFQNILDIDYSIQIRGALRGGLYFIPDTMAVYRWNTEGSWTSKNSNLASQIALSEKKKRMLQELNKETKDCYKAVIEKRLKKNEFNIAILRQDFRTAVKKKNRVFFEELTLTEQAKLYVKAYIPIVYKTYQKIKQRKHWSKLSE